MDFDQLITFLEVARQGSFSRAGEKVFRSQSAVSAQIRQLEQEYGDRLLARSGKTVKLTPAGQVFFEYAEKLKALLAIAACVQGALRLLRGGESATGFESGLEVQETGQGLIVKCTHTRAAVGTGC